MNRPDPYGFALAFTAGMRKARWLASRPTVRTAIALSRLLVVRRLRKGRLTGDDYLECASLVTPPEDQPNAAEVAMRVLNAPTRLPTGAYAPTEESSAVASILAQMTLAKAIEDAGSPGQVTRDIEDLLSDPDFAALINELGGVEAARARFPDAEAIRRRGRRMVRERLGGLSENLFSLAINLGLAETIAAESPSEAESAAAEVIAGNADVLGAMNALEGVDLKLKLLRLLAGARVDIADALQALANDAKRLELLAAIATLGYVQIDRDHLFAAIEGALPDHDFTELFETTESFSAELADQARRVLYDRCPDLDEKQLSDHAHLCAEWKSALEQAVARRARQAAGRTFPEGIGMLRDLYALSRSQGDPVLAQHLAEGIQGVAQGVLQAAETLDELLELMNVTEALGARLPADLVREQGYRLGLTRQEMDQILHSRLALIKRMIDQGERSYQRFARLIEQENPGAQNTSRLVQAALRKNNTAALAALGHHNLGWTLAGADELGRGHTLVVESLSAGPGTNLLVQWFSHRDKIPKNIRAPLRRLAREVLVQYAVALGKELIGDRSRGILEGESARAYAPGDDPALVDLEETIENLVAEGKPLRLIAPEDLRVRETTHGRRAVALLVDISGSMHGEKLTWCSIVAAMLAYCLRPDELALAFFESDTHVVKTFTDRMEIDEVADELLNLASRGGTMLGAALDWITDELAEAGPRRKNALILTDAAIYDLEDCAGPCRLLAALHASTSWFVPNTEWAEREAGSLARWSRGTIVRLHGNWKQFPRLISEALR